MIQTLYIDIFLPGTKLEKTNNIVDVQKEILSLNSSDKNKQYSHMTKIRKDLFINNISFYYRDNTLKMKQRKNIYNEAKKYNYHVVSNIYLSSIEECTMNIIDIDNFYKQLSNFQLPQIGIDCDEIKFINFENDIIFNPYEIINNMKNIEHNSLFHLESIGTHIMSVINAILIEDNIDYNTQEQLYFIALYHDLGKVFTKINIGNFTQYAGHENVSTYLWLINNKFLQDENMDLYLTIAYAINTHSIFLNQKTPKTHPLAIKFQKYDNIGSINGIILYNKKLNKFQLKENYLDNIHYLIDFLEQNNLNYLEKNIIKNSINKQMQLLYK